jgi:two-component system, chemotaxis family, CheB/CheR fusion protein
MREERNYTAFQEGTTGVEFMGAEEFKSFAEPVKRADKASDAAAPRRILIVDDNKDARESLATLLREHGYLALTAHDGYSAIERAAEFKPHAVLLDIVMPGISGFKVAEMLRKQAALADALLITVTGWQQDVDGWLSKDAGCDYHFQKPLDFAVLDELFKTKL